MALNARVVCPHEIELRRIDDVRGAGLPDVLAAWPVATLATDIPFRRRLRLRVVIDGVAAVAQRSGRAAFVRGRIMRHPPVRVRLDEIWPPLPMAHVPLRSERIEVVASLLEVTLFPLRAVNQRDVIQLKGDCG